MHQNLLLSWSHSDGLRESGRTFEELLHLCPHAGSLTLYTTLRWVHVNCTPLSGGSMSTAASKRLLFSLLCRAEANLKPESRSRSHRHQITVTYNPELEIHIWATGVVTVFVVWSLLHLKSMSTHRVSSLDVVLVEEAKVPGDPSVVTVNCPDKAGLGCDLCRIILEFGLRISQADFSTDGRWCYMVFWVVPYSVTHTVRWESLKNRLFYASPSCLGSLCFDQRHSDPSPNALYLLKFCCFDRKGLLHEVTKVISELEFTIEKVKVMSTPDGRVVDLFFITDGMGLLHSKERRDDTCSCLINLFSKYCISCELQLAGPEYESLQAFSSLPPAVAKELFSCGQLEKESDKNTLEKDKTTLSKVSITVDNLLSQAHTLLQIQCVDQKGLFYDILRISKDFNIRIAYGRFASSVKGSRNMDLFIQLNDGRKVLDTKFQLHLCSRLEEEMLNPLRVIIANRGPDTELLVANPVELCGKGRPRVFYDVTLALKKLRICVLLAEIGRHSTHNREWEVYRFVLDDNCEFSLDCNQARNQILDKVKRTLMGW